MIAPAGHPAPEPMAAGLVGRNRELSILREAWAATMTGRGALVLVGGEAASARRRCVRH